MENTSKLICRKCGGPHLTIKCGKTDNNIQKKENYTYKNNKNDNYQKKETKQYYKKEFEKYYKAKISELPKDMTEEELQELLYEWGHIIKINLKAYDNASIAYITFKNEMEVDYLVNALDGTPFEHKIISVEKLDS
jgi:CHAT domain-containing protein